jgi:RNAse (barnase) inhibitor barstar
MTPHDDYRESAVDVAESLEAPVMATSDGSPPTEPRVPTRNVSMPLQTVRPNIVQAIRAYRVDDLMQAATQAGQHFLYANLGGAESKQEVLDTIAVSFEFPLHFGKNLDALYDCMTDLVHKAGQQPGFVVVLDQLPDSPRFDREMREQLLDVFRDAADFWAERKVAFRCFYSFL